jgi:hypothetical protein
MYFVYLLDWMPAHWIHDLVVECLYTTFSFAGMATVGIIGLPRSLIARGYDPINEGIHDRRILIVE